MTESPQLVELDSVLSNNAVDEVLVALPIHKYGNLVETIVRRCEEEGVVVRVRTEFHTTIGKAYTDDLEGVPLITIQSGPVDGWALVAKRLLDITGSAILLVALTPFLAIVKMLIRLDSRGPIFFAQERVGLK